MRTLLTILGGIFLSVAFFASFGVAGFARLGGQLDRRSKACMDEVVPEIVASWDSRELIKHASPELLVLVPCDKIDALFQVFSERLGSLKELKDSRGHVNVSVVLKEGKVTTAFYVAEAVFEKAPAIIQVQTILKDGKWKILQFHVDSEALSPSTSS